MKGTIFLVVFEWALMSLRVLSQLTPPSTDTVNVNMLNMDVIEVPLASFEGNRIFGADLAREF